MNHAQQVFGAVWMLVTIPKGHKWSPLKEEKEKKVSLAPQTDLLLVMLENRESFPIQRTLKKPFSQDCIVLTFWEKMAHDSNAIDSWFGKNFVCVQTNLCWLSINVAKMILGTHFGSKKDRFRSLKSSLFHRQNPSWFWGTLHGFPFTIGSL